MKNKQMSPYLAGSLAGGLLIVSVVIFHGLFGSTTTFARIGNGILQAFNLDLADANFFTDNGANFGWSKILDFQTFFVFGIPLGAFTAAKLSGEFKIRSVSNTFEKKFGNRPKLRYAHAFIGAFIMVIGARIANGCPSWWAISSASRLDLAAFATLAFFLGGAIVTNYLVYGKKFIKENKSC